MSTTLGERIKMLRGETSQQQFADKLSITRQYVALLESDKRDPSPLLIDSLCQKFGIRREWLELGHEPMYTKDASSEPEALVPELVSILADYPAILDAFQRIVGRMTPSDWDRLNALIDDIVNTSKKDPEA